MIGYLAQNYPLIRAFAEPSSARRIRHRSPAAHRVFKLAPNLADAFPEGEILAVKGSLDRPISGLVSDSRRVVPGSLFFALPGAPAEGVASIDDALSRGAVAIVSEHLPALPPARVTFIQVADARASLARVARRFYGCPDRDMAVVGVTGTEGTTTVTHLVKHFLNGDQRVGLLGTIHYDLGQRTVPSFRTTPEALDLHGMMAQMRDAGCRHVVMEVSGPGIRQQRVNGVQWAAAVVTNLTRGLPGDDPAAESACEEAARLFTGGTGTPPRVSVVNLDDPHGEQLAARIAAEVSATRLVTYGECAGALVRAENIALESRRTRFRLVWPGGAMDVASPLIGRRNVSHLLAAIATVWALGRDPGVVLARLKTFAGVPGRMERIEEGQPYQVLVDSARTDDALHNALSLLRAITPGRLLVVFGCGGHRSRTMRPAMTCAVQAFADFAIATADNPRSEPLARIFADMQAGVTAPEKITWIDDRRRAVSLALDLAKPGDCVLIAGKGHEGVQEVADTVYPFDDRQVVRELLGSKAGPGSRWRGHHRQMVETVSNLALRPSGGWGLPPGGKEPG